MADKPDCDQTERTIDSARDCQCDACTRWWCDNVEGYFYCPLCKTACLERAGQYGIDEIGEGVVACEECFDEWHLEHGTFEDSSSNEFNDIRDDGLDY